MYCYPAEDPVLVFYYYVIYHYKISDIRIHIYHLIVAVGRSQVELNFLLCLVQKLVIKISARLHSHLKAQLGKDQFLSSIRLLVELISSWLGTEGQLLAWLETVLSSQCYLEFLEATCISQGPPTVSCCASQYGHFLYQASKDRLQSKYVNNLECYITYYNYSSDISSPLQYSLD